MDFISIANCGDFAIIEDRVRLRFGGYKIRCVNDGNRIPLRLATDIKSVATEFLMVYI